MRKILVAFAILLFFSACSSMQYSSGRRKMDKLNMYMNDHPDRNRIRFK